MAWNKKGQNTEIHSSVVQVSDGQVKVVYPFDGKNADLIYPFPDWNKR
jgi:hypothetical protein